MKTLKIFYLKNCPYCRKAMDALNELKTENPEYDKIETEWIEENLCPDIADSYDYYYVPSVFRGEEKLYECSPGDDYNEIKRQMEKALNAVASR